MSERLLRGRIRSSSLTREKIAGSKSCRTYLGHDFINGIVPDTSAGAKETSHAETTVTGMRFTYECIN